MKYIKFYIMHDLVGKMINWKLCKRLEFGHNIKFGKGINPLAISLVRYSGPFLK